MNPLQELPIIYVRGYAGTQSEVEQTVDDPFYGFNIGSTHIRQDESGDPEFYVFESPLIRLISERQYGEVFNGYRQEFVAGEGRNPMRTVWIHRYYDQTSNTFNNPDPVRATIEDAAWDLKQLIDRVRAQVVAWQKQNGQGEQAPKVHLVAHSMGGLVCRSLLQKVYRDHGLSAKDYVSKLFTYGTPHGGIHFAFPGGSGVEKLRDALGVNGSDVFGQEQLYRFLTPREVVQAKVPKGFDPRDMPKELFDPEHVFCVVGTNARDYEVALGLSRTAVGPQSDGLVQTESAYVFESHRAYIHRSHSGRYGMVNSEEAYQNLQRFLFGDVRAKAVLCNMQLDFATGSDKVTRTYFFETRVAIRNVLVSMHERSLDHLCAVPLNQSQFNEQMQKGGLPLFTSFLDSGKAQNGTMQYMLRVAVHRQDYSEGFLNITHHIERLPLWSDYLVIELRPAAAGAETAYSVFTRWLSSGPNTEPIELPPQISEARIDYVVAVPSNAQIVLGPNAAVRFETTDWE